jgi:hypothetical protein
LTPKISKSKFLGKIFDKSKSFQNFQKTGIYVIQLTIPYAHAKNQVSSSIFGGRIGLKYGKKYNIEIFKVNLLKKYTI